jgi:hypothetical protein
MQPPLPSPAGRQAGGQRGGLVSHHAAAHTLQSGSRLQRRGGWPSAAATAAPGQHTHQHHPAALSVPAWWRRPQSPAAALGTAQSGTAGAAGGREHIGYWRGTAHAAAAVAWVEQTHQAVVPALTCIVPPSCVGYCPSTCSYCSLYCCFPSWYCIPNCCWCSQPCCPAEAATAAVGVTVLEPARLPAALPVP